MNGIKTLTSWSKEQTYGLIEEYKKFPVLYDNTHPFHNIRTQRILAFRKICANIREFKPNVTPKLITCKIKILKTQYSKEKRNIETSMQNLRPGQRPYLPKLWCYKFLKFLDIKGQYDINPSVPLLEEPIEEIERVVEECDFNDSKEVEVDLIDEDHVDETAYIEENHESRNMLHSKCLKLVDCLTKQLYDVSAQDTTAANQKSPSTFLGLMVESELSKVSEDVYDDAKWKIIHILEEASRKSRGKGTKRTSTSSNIASNLEEQTTVKMDEAEVFKTPRFDFVPVKRSNWN